MKNVYKVLVRKVEVGKTIWRPRRRHEDNIKMNLKGIEPFEMEETVPTLKVQSSQIYFLSEYICQILFIYTNFMLAKPNLCLCFIYFLLKMIIFGSEKVYCNDMFLSGSENRPLRAGQLEVPTLLDACLFSSFSYRTAFCPNFKICLFLITLFPTLMNLMVIDQATGRL
jgi:hypothetical protein